MINIILILKGLLIGIAKVIPGVSGSLVAVSMGLYEKGIEAISHPFHSLKENFIFLGNVGIGILLSVAFGSGIIGYFLFHFPFFTTLLFVGFIIGTFPALYRDVQIDSFKDVATIFFIAFLLTIITNVKANATFVYENSIIHNFFVFCFGVIDAATMIIPGISGTAIFMILGCYPFILSLFSSIIDGGLFSGTLVPLFFFGLGLIIGTIVVAKCMSYAFKRHYKATYICIFGFALSSIFLLLFDVASNSPTIIELFVGAILVIFATVVSFFLNKQS